MCSRGRASPPGWGPRTVPVRKRKEGLRATPGRRRAQGGGDTWVRHTMSRRTRSVFWNMLCHSQTPGSSPCPPLTDTPALAPCPSLGRPLPPPVLPQPPPCCLLSRCLKTTSLLSGSPVPPNVQTGPFLQKASSVPLCLCLPFPISASLRSPPWPSSYPHFPLAVRGTYIPAELCVPKRYVQVLTYEWVVVWK